LCWLVPNSELLQGWESYEHHGCQERRSRQTQCLLIQGFILITLSFHLFSEFLLLCHPFSGLLLGNFSGGNVLGTAGPGGEQPEELGLEAEQKGSVERYLDHEGTYSSMDQSIVKINSFEISCLFL
jgi:hypothetical protein